MSEDQGSIPSSKKEKEMEEEEGLQEGEEEGEEIYPLPCFSFCLGFWETSYSSEVGLIV